jgi:hypothetical protein
MGKLKEGYSSPRERNGFSGNSRSSTLGPKVLGLLLGRGMLSMCGGMGDTSMGGGAPRDAGTGYVASKSSEFGSGACRRSGRAARGGAGALTMWDELHSGSEKGFDIMVLGYRMSTPVPP